MRASSGELKVGAARRCWRGQLPELLAERGDKLEALAQALLKAESLNEKEIRDVTGLTEPPGQKEDTPSRLQADTK